MTVINTQTNKILHIEKALMDNNNLITSKPVIG